MMTVLSPATRRVYLTRVRDFVEGAAFPASPAELVHFAERKNTPSAIVADLLRLPAARYERLAEVVTAIDALRFGAPTA